MRCQGVIVYMKPDESDSFGKGVFLPLYILAVVVVVASYLLVLFMGYGFMYFTPGGVTLSAHSRPFPVLVFLFLIGFETPELPFGAVFGFFWLIYVVCFAAAWRWRESFHSVLAKSFSRPFTGVLNNFLVSMPLLSSMALTAATFIVYSLQFGGVPTGQLAFPPGASSQEMFFTAAYAPPVEELAFRLIPMGVFTMFYVFFSGRSVTGGRLKLAVTSFVYPEGAKRAVGLRNVSEHGFWRGISRWEWVMVAATSALFAVYHVLGDSGWEAGKIVSVLVQALFLGSTYLAYGFEAPILLHWFFNYYSFFFDPNLLSEFFPGTEPVLSIVELVILGLGILGWLIFAVMGVRKLTRPRPAKKEVLLPPPPPPEPTLPS